MSSHRSALVRFGTFLVALIAAIVVTVPARAAGMLIPRDGSPPIRVQSHRVTAVVEDGLARTTVRQTFVNTYGRALEAIYTFPVPEGAALVDLAMETGGQRLEGLLAERRTARRVYDQIVSRQRDPALVEQIGRSTFRLSVFPVLPDQPTVVEITWIEPVPLTQGEYRYVYPLALGAAGGEAATTDQDLTVSVTIRSSAPLAGVSSATPGMAVRIESPHEARASMEKSGAVLDRDLVVVARVAATEPSLSVRTFRGAKGDPFFAAVITPPDVSEDRILARDITLVLDTSGSMEGEKMAQAKASGLWLLGHLRAKDRVNVVLFADAVRRFAEAPVDASEENLAALRAFVNDAVAQGSTALGDAIQAAAAAPATPGRVAMAVLLTDGLATVGETAPEKIVGFAKAGADRGLRTFTFGVGSDVNATLLEGVARAGRGASETFRPQGEVETRLRAFLTRTASPVLANLRFEIDGRTVDDLLPRPLPDLFLGEQAVLSGRFAATAGEHEVVVRGFLDGKEIRLAAKAAFSAEPGGAAVVRDVYARQKLAFLEQALRLRNGLSDDAYFAALDRGAYSTADELTKAIIDLSLETGVQCPYTSFLALLPEDRVRTDPRDTAALDEALRRATAKRRELAGRPAERRDVDPPAHPDTREADAPKPAQAPVTPQPSLDDDDTRGDGRRIPFRRGDDPITLRDEDPPPTPEETRSLEESERVTEDPVLKDAKVSDHNETDDDMAMEDSLGDPRFNSDAPFEGPGTNGTIGIGGGAGGAFGGRMGGHRNLKAGGGGKRSQTAVDLALEWLKNHQSPDGRWDADAFDAQCRLNKCGGLGAHDADPGVTGLALLTFLGAGETHQSGNYKDTVKAGLKYLRNIQDTEGCFGPRTSKGFVLNHLAATLAMTEAYGMTQSVIFKDAAQRGVNFVHQCQTPYLGWGPGVRDGDNDTMTTVWAVMCLRSAMLADLDVDKRAFTGALAWLDKMTDPATGAVGARRRGEADVATDAASSPFAATTPESLVAAATFARILCHATEGPVEFGKDPLIAKGCERMLTKLPDWNIDTGAIDYQAWYFGSLAAFQVGGDTWKLWNEALQKAVVDHQRTEAARDERGSWDAEGPGTKEGGRVYATALNALCMEVYYRYGRVFGTK